MIINKFDETLTKEEAELLARLDRECEKLESDIDDPSVTATWEQKQEERYNIESAIELRYMNGITMEQALDDAKEILENLTWEDYTDNVKKYIKTFGNNADRIRGRVCPEGALSFINGCIRLQRIKFVGAEDFALRDDLQKMAFSKLEEWFPKKDTSLVPWKPDTPFAVPNGEPIFFLYKLLNAGKGTKESGRRTIKPSTTNRHEKIEKLEVFEGDKILYTFIRTVTSTKHDESTGRRVEVPKYEMTTQISQLTLSKHKGFLKIFHFLLMVMAARDFPPEILIPYKWFVDFPIQMYATVSTAKRALALFMKQIVDVKMVTQYANKKGILEPHSASVLFYDCVMNDKYIKILANREFDWNSLCNYFTVNPQFIFRLNENAFALTQYIFYIARQKLDDFTDAKEGELEFNINMKTIADYLGLPPVDVIKNRDYRPIKKSIEDAVEEIERETETDPTCKDLAFALEFHVPDTNDINEWLAEGQLKVFLKRDFTKKFLEISQRKEEILKKKEKMSKITEKAKAQEAGKIAARQEAAVQKKKSKE